LLQLAWKHQEGSPPIANPLESTFQQHHSMVFRTAYRMTGNAADAEDVLQTVFLRLLRRVEQGELQQPESYLRRAAINVSIDLIRERRNQPQASEHPPEQAGGSDAGLKHALREAIAQLEPRDAEMFALRFFEGLSNEEIAAAFGMNKFHVAVVLHRTRGRLQKFFRS
jgi:RNA polymerase sigma factor (sigma-70 family)